MTKKTSLYEQREAVEHIIDRGEWKNSWHLPKDRNGYTAYFLQETYTKCKELLEEARQEACNLLEETNRLLRTIDWELLKDDSEATP